MRATGVLMVAGVALAGSCGGAKPCSFETCATGCCDSTGTCQPGTGSAACGSNALSCAACVGGQTCSAGFCTTPGSGGGGGTSPTFSSECLAYQHFEETRCASPRSDELKQAVCAGFSRATSRCQSAYLAYWSCLQGASSSLQCTPTVSASACASAGMTLANCNAP